ncbi:MAG: PAS domain S-box protein [Planctomycetes bacterium]|nr:PAS domain S-box protein [Planctomycetota bacterium]
MEVQFVLVLSILFQFASTVLAIRLVRVTGGQWAWAVIAFAFGLMALRRTIGGLRVFSSDVAVQANLAEECVALTISVLILWGLTSIAPFFTSIQRSEATLQESQSRLFAILENVADGIITINEQGVIQSINRAAESMFGYTSGELVGENVSRLAPSPDREQHNGYLRRYLETGVGRIIGQRREIVGQRKDGSIFPVDIHVSESPLPRGRLFVGIVSDITQRKKAEEQLRRQQVELAAVSRMTTIGGLATAIAHELNQPLTAIVNYAKGSCLRFSAGEETAPNRREVAKVMELIADQGLRAGEIIKSLRKLVGKAEPKQSTSDINEVIDEVIQLLRADARFHGSIIEVSVADNLPLVLVDRIQIQQVLVNLVHNAVEAMAGAATPDRRVLITANAAGGNAVEVAVQDSGPGLDADLLARIFDPFFSTKSEGLGIGLSISRSIIEAHGGSLTASANIHQGMTFRFTLPVADGVNQHGVEADRICG